MSENQSSSSPSTSSMAQQESSSTAPESMEHEAVMTPRVIEFQPADEWTADDVQNLNSVTSDQATPEQSETPAQTPGSQYWKDPLKQCQYTMVQEQIGLWPMEKRMASEDLGIAFGQGLLPFIQAERLVHEILTKTNLNLILLGMDLICDEDIRFTMEQSTTSATAPDSQFWTDPRKQAKYEQTQEEISRWSIEKKMAVSKLHSAITKGIRSFWDAKEEIGGTLSESELDVVVRGIDLVADQDEVNKIDVTEEW